MWSIAGYVSKNLRPFYQILLVFYLQRYMLIHGISIQTGVWQETVGPYNLLKQFGPARIADS